MKAINWRDVGSRALKTFVQAFFGVLVTEFAAIAANVMSMKHFDIAALAALAAAALASAVSATWNTVFAPILLPGAISKEEAP